MFGDKGYVNEKKNHMARAAGVYRAVKEKRKSGRQLSGSQRKRNRKHGSVRAKVEHVFHVAGAGKPLPGAWPIDSGGRIGGLQPPQTGRQLRN